jgi:REP element-mobilizing transposase RayT
MRLPHITPFAKAPLIFFTACASDRRPVLANQAAFATIGGVWRKSGQLDGWYVGRFVFMPDHVHFFAKPVAEAKPMGTWNKMWKSVTARVLARKLNLSPPLWQGDTLIIFCAVLNYMKKSGNTSGKIQSGPGCATRPTNGRGRGKSRNFPFEYGG